MFRMLLERFKGFNLRNFLGLGYYVSELDNFLTEFDKKHPELTAAQRAEKEKYDRIYALRDNPAPKESSSTLWKDF